MNNVNGKKNCDGYFGLPPLGQEIDKVLPIELLTNIFSNLTRNDLNRQSLLVDALN